MNNYLMLEKYTYSIQVSMESLIPECGYMYLTRPVIIKLNIREFLLLRLHK